MKQVLATTFCACLTVIGYIQSASAADRNLFVGAIRGETQLGVASSSSLLLASGHVGLFLNTLSLLHAIVPDPSDQEDWGGSVANGQAIVSAFAGNGPGIIEGYLDAQTTPHVPSADYNYSRNDAWLTWLPEIKWSPSIFLMNMNATGSPTTTQYTSTNVQDVLTGTSDIKSEDPAIKYVLPYLSPNGGVYGSWVNDAYWSTARNLALAQKGFAIDVPVGYYLDNPAAYKQVVKDEITWGIKNNLIVIVLLSPYDTQNPSNCNIPRSFCADPNFMSSSQSVVTDLINSGADPTIYIVSNYSEQSASPQPGTDDASSSSYNPNSIFAVAYAGIQDGVPTSPYPTSAAGIESP